MRRSRVRSPSAPPFFVRAPVGAAACQHRPAAASSSPTWEQIRARGVLRIGTPGDYAPYSARDARSGAYVGADIALARELALELGLRAEFVPTSWTACSMMPRRARFDIALGGISITRGTRAFAYSFPRAYCQRPQVAGHALWRAATLRHACGDQSRRGPPDRESGRHERKFARSEFPGRIADRPRRTISRCSTKSSPAARM